MRAINEYEQERFDAIRDADNIALASTEIDGRETAAIVALAEGDDGMILMHVLAVLVPATDRQSDDDSWVGAHLLPPGTGLEVDVSETPLAPRVSEQGVAHHAHLDWREGSAIRPRVAELVALRAERDCTEDESVEIMGLMDDATPTELDALASVWPLEQDQWSREREEGNRG